MRPNVDIDPTNVYECFECGHRDTEPHSTNCPDCGGPTRNIGVRRDL